MSQKSSTTISAIEENLRNRSLTPIEAINEFNQAITTPGFKQKTKEQRLAQYKASTAARAEILSNKVPFITDRFLPDFYLSQGVILVGAESGKSKSTTCSNILAGFLKHSPTKSAIVITNEEAVDAVYDRTACILLGVSYVDFYKRKLPPVDVDAVQETSMRLMDQVEVVEEMSCFEDVVAVLDTAASNGVKLVCLDYLQTVTHSRESGSLESYQVSKNLGLYLRDYGKRHGVPVVVLAQLSDASVSSSMAARVQNDKTFYNHAFIAVEVVPDFNALTTTFTIHKDRMGAATGKKVVMDYRGGAYKPQEGL